MINPFHLEQAILNVINNAIHAMSAGGKLTVKTMIEKIEGRSFVIIEISDTGPGMLESRIDKLASRNCGGKGFGLFITDEVLKRHGGHLEVKSRRGEGTAVKLYLPIREERGLNERG
jgi:two-component system nitrogen regulation sensor histidine kinase GlnL